MSEDTQLLTPEEIFASDDIGTFDVEMPEWKKKDGSPGIIRLRMLSGRDLAAYTDAVDGAAKRNAMILIIMKSAINADGTLLFPDQKQIALLQQKSVKAFSRLQDEILRINGLTPASRQALKND